MPHGKYTNDAATVGAAKVASADTRRNGVPRKLELIMSYIGQVAAATYGGDVSLVPCPERQEWAQLSNGRGAALPTEGALMLSGSERRITHLRKQHPQLSILEAWFELGRQDLLSALAAQAAKTTPEED